MDTLQNLHTGKIDPVCSMKVKPDKTNHIFNYNGEEYYFCCNGCLDSFRKEPGKYLKQKRKGMWGRYLDRLAKSTDGKSMKCH
jgi:YHS domain-containing protein